MPVVKPLLLFVALLVIPLVAPATGNEEDAVIDAEPANPWKNPYDARSYPDRLEIFNGDERVCGIRAGKQDIDRWGFIDEGNYLVVESRDRNGQAVTELFKTASCERVDAVTESEGPGNKPAWANIFAE